MKPVLFVTGHAPAYRAGAFARLHEQQHIELALVGGRARHGGELAAPALAVPLRRARPRDIYQLAASGRYRAVVCSTAGRLAPSAAWAGARRARAPLILWASLWAHPRTPAHVLTYAPLRALYRSADAVVTYGAHVSAYVRARGARNVYVAPQSVDNDFWSAPADAQPRLASWPQGSAVRFLFVGRPAREKGVDVLLSAWSQAVLGARGGLVLAGVGDELAPRLRSARLDGDGVLCTPPLARDELRSVYASCDVLVLPSIRTRNFREPWGLVINEAMNRKLPVITSDEVGAAAGGLVRDGINGLVVRAGDAAALRQALQRLYGDPALRARLGETGATDVRAYSHDAWAQGFSRALESVGVSRGRW
jgi:glycosyltransferase involved in cell wall biosynthesis